VGKDTGAQAFLGALDTDPQVGKQIDCTSYYENESEEFKRKGMEPTPELWLVKLLVGSIDPSYDEQVVWPVTHMYHRAVLDFGSMLCMCRRASHNVSRNSGGAATLHACFVAFVSGII